MYPVPPAPRTAVLVPWFARDNHNKKTLVRVFATGWGGDAAAFAPAAVAGTLEQLCALDRHMTPTLTYALIVLGRPGMGRLTEEHRDRLWRAFRLPVFEQIIGKSGELLAAECEAHDGLHVESRRLPIENEYVDSSACPCGRKTPRIGCRQGADLLRRVAAYAR